MSTNGYENWAIDLGEVGAIYPFQGGEVILVILGLVFWIAWHVIQFRQEKEDIAYDMEHENDPEAVRRALERY